MFTGYLILTHWLIIRCTKTWSVDDLTGAAFQEEMMWTGFFLSAAVMAAHSLSFLEES